MGRRCLQKIRQGRTIDIFHDDARPHFGILAPANATHNMFVAIQTLQQPILALQPREVLCQYTLVPIQGFEEQLTLSAEHGVQNTVARTMIRQASIVVKLGIAGNHLPKRSRSETIFHLWPIIDAKVKKTPLI